MTNPFEEAARKSVWYPDELDTVGTVELVSEEPEAAEDVPHSDAKFGDFVQVKQNGTEFWMACPKDLKRALGEAEATPGHLFQVRDATEPEAEHDPWQFKVAHDPEQH